MRDLDFYRNLRRPAAGIKVGDRVIITGPYVRRGHERAGTVSTIARVWISVDADGDPNPMRFRLDTQTTGVGESGYEFATPEQAEFDQRVAEAQRVLRDHRVDVVSRAKVPDGHLIAMADLLAALDQPAKEA